MRTIHNALNANNPRVIERLTVGPFDLTINPQNREEFASINRNRAVALAGVEPSIDEIRRTTDAFRSRGIDRYFLWFGPGASTPDAFAALASCGLNESPLVQYLVLSRPATEVPMPPSTLEVVRLEPNQTTVKEEQVAAVYGNPIAACGFFRSLGLPGYTHFVAMENGEVAAASLLYIGGRIGYLGWANTRKESRGKGGQSALIAARLRHATQNGCEICTSETNTAVEPSLRNLVKAGFKLVYPMRVFGPA